MKIKVKTTKNSKIHCNPTMSINQARITHDDEKFVYCR